MITLDARSFLVALRRAVTRQEQIAAIEAYVGYDPRQDHGAQDLAARMKAQRELSRSAPAAKAPVAAQPVHTLKGYVAGAVDRVERQRQDLLARERLAGETLADHARIVADARSTAETKHWYANLIRIEEDRLSQIRSDLRELSKKSA